MPSKGAWPEHALVTGAEGQLGSALAEKLASHGCNLSICGLNQAGLDQLQTRLEHEYSIGVSNAVLDIRDRSAVDDWICDRARERAIDWAFLNAAIAAKRDDDGLLEPAQAMAELVDVNLSGTINCLQPIIKVFREQGRGKIILISSLSAIIGFPNAPTYAATKAAIRILGLSLHEKLNQIGIGVTIVSPGFLKSPLSSVTDLDDWDPPSAVSAEDLSEAIIHAVRSGKVELQYPKRVANFLKLVELFPPSLRAKIVERLT